MELTYDEIVDILNVKYIAGSTIGCKLSPGIYELIEIFLMFKTLLHNKVKVKVTINDLSVKSNLTTFKRIRFSIKSFFYKIPGSTQPHSGVLGDIKGSIQLTPETYKSDKPIKITGIDKNHLKCDCLNGSIFNGVKSPFLFSLSLDKFPGHELHKKPRIKLLKTINESFLSHITFYLEDDDGKPVYFNGEISTN